MHDSTALALHLLTQLCVVMQKNACSANILLSYLPVVLVIC